MPPTQLQIFIKISRIGFPGNQVKNYISSDSEFFTESESLFGLGKICTGKKSAPRNSAYVFIVIKSVEKSFQLRIRFQNHFILFLGAEVRVNNE